MVVVATIIITGCSRKKNTFISRNYHAVTAEYNTLYNGYNALNDGVKALNEAYKDDYWDILPVERMQVSEEILMPGQDNKNPNFERAEEKATKAIQKHAINVKGKEYNPQMDEAYLLLGKARYYDQRFIPAIEAFNYILYKYAASDKINQAKIWRAKTNIRLENNELAIENLKRLMKQEVLSDQDLADAKAMLAQAYLNTKSVDSALAAIKIAAAFTKKNEEKGRYNFIKGQLYNALGEKDSANLAFDQVIDLHRKIPRVYYISAHLEKIKNYDFENGNKLAFIEYLTDLEENRENRPFLDRIYHRIAEFYNTDDSDSLAVAYYNKSLRTNSTNKRLVALNYQRMGDMYFDSSEYSLAGSYYDSTMLNMKENSKPYRIIKRKRDNLQDVIFYEAVAKRNDSILNIVNLPKEDQLAVFQELVDKLKAADEAKKEAEEAAARRSKGLQMGDKINNQSGVVSGKTKAAGSTFYFYNPTTVAYGKNEFVKIWGNRAYKDNWRWSKSGMVASAGATPIENDLENLSEEEKYNPEAYLSLLPSSQKAVDSIAKERNFAYYQLGLIYKNKFKEFELSKVRLKKLLNNNPEERLILPSKYNLYKVYLELGQTGDAEIVKKDIIANYPDSRYAAILLNPDQDLGKDMDSPESIYENLLQRHEKQEYETVIAQCEDNIKRFDGEAIVPKFEFLKATASGRLYGFEAYKKAINYIALNYPNSPEGKKAEILIQEALPKISGSEFQANDISSQFKVVYTFTNPTEDELNTFKKALDAALKTVKYYDLSSSIDVYDKTTTFVVVHGLKSINGAKGFAEILGEDDKHKIKKDHFAISSKNYEIVQIHKNLKSYLQAQ